MNKEILMLKLGLTEDEAIELIKNDKEVDKMVRISDINSDLSAEQIQESKKARSSGRTKKNTPIVREKKVNEPKKEIIAALVSALSDAENIDIINDEREFTFIKNGVKYKLTLSVPRK